jgi:hypothetical protein
MSKADGTQGAFEALVKELDDRGLVTWALPADWIICFDSDVLRYIPKMTERKRILKKAKAELTRLKIQERVDEIAEAWESEEPTEVEMLLEAFPQDLEVYKIFSILRSAKNGLTKLCLLASVGLIRPIKNSLAFILLARITTKA